ncbi:hypothetical protein JW968_02080 [Candidatus Woesearchaeota archaeon]|nr:hypothetical protein [Candidatus Woesearchaeota archaeon]
MGIQTEYNPDLALRAAGTVGRKKEECVPEDISAGSIYEFLKKGQRNYWLEGELPLVITRGNQELSRPIASIIILEATHFISEGEVWTKGKYRIIEVFGDDKIHFDGFARIRP